MKYGQVIEYNMRNIFLEKSYAKCGGEASPRHFHDNQNQRYLLINSLKCRDFPKLLRLTQPAFASSKSTIETPEQCVKYVQS